MQIHEALENYLTQLRGDGRSPHTIDQARRHVRLFAGWLESTGHNGTIEDVRHEDLARFCSSEAMRLRADGGPRKATSANVLRSSLRAFFGYAHDAGYTGTNAARLVRRAKCGAPPPRGIGAEACARLLAELDRSTDQLARRDRVIVEVLLRVGLRVGSVVALDVGDVDLDEGTLTLRLMKNADHAVVFVPADTLARLRIQIGERTRGPLFVGSHGGRITTRQVARRLAKWARTAGIGGTLAPHRCRHEFAVRLLRRTSNVALVSRALCHRSLTSTMVYARVGDDTVRAALEG